MLRLSTPRQRLLPSDKAPVDPDDRFLLVGRQPGIQLDGMLDAVMALVAAFGIVQQSRLGIHRRRRDVERVGNALEHVGRGLVKPPLNLAEIWIGDLGDFRQLAHREIRKLALAANEVAEAPPRSARAGFFVVRHLPVSTAARAPNAGPVSLRTYCPGAGSPSGTRYGSRIGPPCAAAQSAQSFHHEPWCRSAVSSHSSAVSPRFAAGLV